MNSIFDGSALEAFRKENKLDPYRIRQIFTEIFKNSVLDFNQITTLPKEIRTKLSQSFFILPLTCEKQVNDGEVVKFVFKTHDGKYVESVLMLHEKTSGTEKVPSTPTKQQKGKGNDKKNITNINRLTLCVSSQAGCPVGCVFCVTGKMGLVKNLSMEEILGQVLYANAYIKQKRGKKEDNTRHRVRNVVFMGMGEPFLNYENVMATLPYLTDVRYLGIGKRHVTISTCGITPAIKRFVNDNPPASLAFSLHAPTQDLRETLVPFAKNFPLDEVMQALDAYVKKTGMQVFYEYVLIKEKNDTDTCAHQTGKLLRNRKAHLNLIPYNQNPTIDLQEPPYERCVRFKEIVESYGVTVTIRTNMGRNSKSACGQLGWELLETKKQ